MRPGRRAVATQVDKPFGDVDVRLLQAIVGKKAVDAGFNDAGRDRQIRHVLRQPRETDMPCVDKTHLESLAIGHAPFRRMIVSRRQAQPIGRIAHQQYLRRPGIQNHMRRLPIDRHIEHGPLMGNANIHPCRRAARRCRHGQAQPKGDDRRAGYGMERPHIASFVSFGA